MAAPPGYNPTPLTPSAGGTIHAMSGGGDGGAPPGYNSTPLIPYVAADIKAYTGGGPNDNQAVNATAANATAANATATNATPVATATATITANATPVASVKKGPTVLETALTKKQISLGGLRLSIGPPPWNLKEGSNEMEALAWFGVDKAPDVKLKEEVLDALYEGVCDTDKPLIMVLECEPIRRLVQSLAEKLLGNLTRPVVKKTAAEIAAIAEQQKKKAKLMSFNVFKNQCKTKTAKDYIDKSDADIVCTQQDTKTEFTNYTEIKACGDANSATRVYLRKNTPFKLDIECIEGDHSAAIFTYQGVTIVNMGSSNQELLKKILEKNPNIILGSVNDIILPSDVWIRADTINKELNMTDAIWYKKEDELFELKNTTVDNIKVKGDDYTKPELCSFSDHNPITVEIHFKKTLKQLASNADEAAKVAAVSSQITSTPNSGIVSTLGLTPNMAGSTIKQLTANELQQKAAKELEEATALAAATALATTALATTASDVELDDELAKKIAVAAVAAMLQEDDEQGNASHKSARVVEDPDAASAQETSVSQTLPGSDTVMPLSQQSSATSFATSSATSSAAEVAPSHLQLSNTSSQDVAGLPQSPLSTAIAVPDEVASIAQQQTSVSSVANAATGSVAASLPTETTVLQQTFPSATIVEPVAEQVAELAASQMPISSTAPSTQPNLVPVEKIASAAAATVEASSSAAAPNTTETVAALSSSAVPNAVVPNAVVPNAAVPVAVEEISDELAKKIAVAAVAVILQNGNQGSIAQSGIATSVTPRTHEQLLANSINGLNNNKMSVNNEHNIVHYNEAPHDNEFESSSSIQPTTPSSTSSSNSSPVVFHHAKNNDNKPLGVINQKTSSTVGLHSSAYPTASQPSSTSSTVKPIYKNELDSLLANIDLTTFNNDKPEGPIPSVRPTNSVPIPVGNGNNRLLTKAKANTAVATIERTGNQSINLTENFEKKNALTAELKKPKKILGLNQQIKNEGTNFSKSRVEEPVAEPIVEPVAKPTMKPVPAPMTNSLNALMASPKKIVSEKVALTPNQQPLRKLVRIHGRIEQTIYAIEEYTRNMNRSNDPLQTAKRKILDNYISTLKSFLPEIIGYKGMKSEYQNNKRVTDIITKADNIIGDVHKIIYSSGGKRRTQKKRKQKKQKKRFGTQKK